MSIGGHLREFRNRAIVAAIAILAGTIVGWIIYDPIFEFLKQPITDLQKAKPDAKIDVNFNGVTQPFTLKFKISVWVGFILASPVWLWQIWAFLVPGLTKRERFIGRAFIGAAVPLFLAGIYMGTLSFRTAVEFLLEATPEHASNLPTALEYFSFVSRFILAFGLSFLLPIFLMAFNTAGVLSGRMMLRGWRVAVIAITTFAALMTPTPDVWTMFLMAAPLLLLYYGSVAFAMFMDRLRSRRRRTTRPDWMDTADDQASTL